jgi:tetratricopeptide (TPR) repeat protein
MRENRIKVPGNSFFYLMIIATLAVVLISGTIGERQDEIYLQDRVKLAQVEKYVNEGNIALAESVFIELIAKYPKSFPLYSNYGDTMAIKGDYEAAVTYYRRAQEVYPLIVKEEGFSLKMGESLYKLKKYREAAKYLQIAQILNEKDREKVTQLLSNITYEVAGETHGE